MKKIRRTGKRRKGFKKIDYSHHKKNRGELLMETET